MRIRQAVPADSARLCDLFVETEQHHGPDNSHLKQTIEDRVHKWPEDMPSAIVLLAERADGYFLGHISAAPIYPSGAGATAMFVKDFFVREMARGRGPGEALLRACAIKARKRGASRVELTVDPHNGGANRLYERLGATDTQKRYLRWEGDHLDALAEEQANG